MTVMGNRGANPNDGNANDGTRMQVGTPGTHSGNRILWSGSVVGTNVTRTLDDQSAISAMYSGKIDATGSTKIAMLTNLTTGAPAQGTSANARVVNTAVPLWIGSQSMQTQFTGTIDDALWAAWNRSLTSAEETLFYNTMKSFYSANFPTATF